MQSFALARRYLQTGRVELRIKGRGDCSDLVRRLNEAGASVDLTDEVKAARGEGAKDVAPG